MAPGAKFSTMTSARFTMFLTRSSPRSDLRLTVMDFLLALNNRKYQESWFWLWFGPDCRPNKERPASPPCGFSTLTTSAPSQASASVQDGPASNWVRSRTRTPARKAGNPPFVAIFPSSLQWHRLCQMWMSWTLIGAFGIRSNQAQTAYSDDISSKLYHLRSKHERGCEPGRSSKPHNGQPGSWRRAAGDVYSFIAVIVRFWSRADIGRVRCLLRPTRMTQSGHRPDRNLAAQQSPAAHWRAILWMSLQHLIQNNSDLALGFAALSAAD